MKVHELIQKLQLEDKEAEVEMEVLCGWHEDDVMRVNESVSEIFTSSEGKVILS